MATPVATSVATRDVRHAMPVEGPVEATLRRVAPVSVGRLEWKLAGRRLVGMAATLLAIAYLTSWGLLLAEHGREHLPILPFQAALQALSRTVEYLFSHPDTYFWVKEEIPWTDLVARTLGNSAGLLLLSMGVALLIGLPLGVAAAVGRNRSASALIMLVSLLGISTASFLVAMMFWVANIWVHRTFDVRVLPSAGFGWDGHMIMPALVLAMRPLAQLAQVSYVTMRDILKQDYIRTAFSKGLPWRRVRDVHVLPNVLIPILNTLGSSLRFSLASLPVVEVFFDWPGVGSMLLDAINAGTGALVVDLILSLGLFFLLVNLLIEFTFPLIDPRLRQTADTADRADRHGPVEGLRDAGATVAAWVRELRNRWSGKREPLPPLLTAAPRPPSTEKTREEPTRARWFIGHFLRNPPLIVGSIVLVVLFGLALFGEQLSDASPYQPHGVMQIEGEFVAPPFQPSTVFPWGTDHLGRDIRALVLAGARRTLSLAFFAMLARVIVGGALGLLAGWQRGGWIDRMVTSAMGVWAAFPVTLFAMIVIQALGIQQGMWVFVVAISIVGWGEVAQFVRGQVISLKPQLFVEAARSVGARGDQILIRHILPNLVNAFIVLGALEMAGVLMLLAELGFLNIFMGGGFRAMIGESGRMVPVIAYYSDVPEWAALIANVRQYWRTYSWMALFPGLAVFVSVMGFNLFGEGLRRFLDDSHVNLSRFFNRTTFLFSAAIAVMVAMLLRSSVPLSIYRPEGLAFEPGRVLRDIETLSDLQTQGRETGTPGAELAALYIGERMAETGIFPAGEHHTYYQRLVQPRFHLLEMPVLAVVDASGGTLQSYEYGQDFAEFPQVNEGRGTTQAALMGVAFGPALDTSSTGTTTLSNSAAMDHVIIVRQADLPKLSSRQLSGVLVIADNDSQLARRDLYSYGLVRTEVLRPHLLVTAETADELLRTAGSSLEELDSWRDVLGPGEIRLTAEGATLSLSVEPRRADNYLEEVYINVLGVIPGKGSMMGLDEQVIVIGAYYDGLGTDPAGTVYPGANDNASGVAVMLELARLMKQTTFQPDKTIIFAAWAGGEREEGLSVANIMNARPGANKLTVETVFELSGVGYGSGEAISIGEESSYRLVSLFQEAANRYSIPTTTRGRGPHFGLPPPSIYGGREAMTLALSWDGSDDLAHTTADVATIIDPLKLQAVGRSSMLTLLVLSRETDY